MRKYLVPLCALLLLATGCRDNSNPGSTVKSLGYSVKKQNFKTYRGLLKGAALAQFGDQVGFAKITNELQKYDDLKISAPVLLSEKKVRGVDSTTYQIDVYGDNRKIFTTRISCEGFWDAHRGACSIDDYGPDRSGCPTSQFYNRSCFVTGIRR